MSTLDSLVCTLEQIGAAALDRDGLICRVEVTVSLSGDELTQLGWVTHGPVCDCVYPHAEAGIHFAS